MDADLTACCRLLYATAICQSDIRFNLNIGVKETVFSPVHYISFICEHC
jgi:hypothetical protein